jgi:hypothetical protein
MKLTIECSEMEMAMVRDCFIDKYHELKVGHQFSERRANLANFCNYVGQRVADQLRTQQHVVNINSENLQRCKSK